MKKHQALDRPAPEPPLIGAPVIVPGPRGSLRRSLGRIAQVERQAGGGRWTVRTDSGWWYDVRRSTTQADAWVYTAIHLLPRWRTNQLHFTKGTQ